MTRPSLPEITVKSDAPILEALERLNAGSQQIVLVIGEGGRLEGVVTDGDVRRGLLRGIGLDRPVSAVMNRTFVTAPAESTDEALLALMRDKDIKQIPLVGKGGRVVGLRTLEAVLQSHVRPNWVALMAGGLGTRLHPLTESTPKPLLPVGSKPLLETTIENMAAQGFRTFFISVNYRGEMIKEHFGDGSRWGVDITYLEENERLGTAGSLRLLPGRPEHPLIVMNGDLLTAINFNWLLRFHAEHGAFGTMCVREHEQQIPYGVVEFAEHRLMRLVEKPVERVFVNAGIYVLAPGALDLIPDSGAFDMPELFSAMLDGGREATVFPIREYWLDIGRHDDLERARREFGSIFGRDRS